jgi:hypothetical protein
MNASHRCAGIYWPVMLMVLAAGWLLLPPWIVPTAGAAQLHAAAAPLPDPVLQDDEFPGEDEDEGPASNQPPFTVASVVGTFAWTHIGHGGQFPSAGLGVLTFDGAGTFSGTVTLNLPGEDFTNRIPDYRTSFSGSYTLNPDGTGTSTARFTLPGSGRQETSSHFVVTKAVVRGGRRIARELKLVADRLSVISGNLDVAVLKQIPSGGFSNASLSGTYGEHGTSYGGAQPAVDAGFTTFDGRGNTTVYFNQNIPGEENIPGFPAPSFSQRQVFSGSANLTYQVNPDGTGKSNVAHFVITEAKKIGNQVVATEVFSIADALDRFSGNLHTTTLTRLSLSPNPERGGFTAASLKGMYGGKVIGRGGPTQQITAAMLRFDGAGGFDGPGTINLPGQVYGQRIFLSAPFVGTYTVQPNGFGTTLNGGESYFVITKSKLINGVNIATEFALVVRELQPTGNLITAIFTRLPDGGELSAASLRGIYAANAIGYGGQMPEAGVGTFTFNGAGVSSISFFQNIPGSTVFDRQIFEGTNIVGSYTVDANALGQALFPNATIGIGESAFVITKASVRNNVKIAEEFFLIVKDYSPLSRSILAWVGTRIGD